MKAIYLITTEGQVPPSTATSMAAARRIARRFGARVITGGSHNEWYGYTDRAAMARDSQGGAPHLIVAQIDRVVDARAAIEQEEYPVASLNALRAAVGVS